MKLLIHNPHSDTERKQEQGHIYQTVISHHSNKSRINTNYMKHELMAILGVLLGESHRGFSCSSRQSTVKAHSSLIPKSQELSPCPAASLERYVDRSLNSMKVDGIVSTLRLILIGSLKTQFWKLLPSLLSTGTLMVQFQS